VEYCVWGIEVKFDAIINMKKLAFFLLFCAACGGKLTDEQRKKLHEGMATQDIKRVTPAELQEAALAYGKNVLVLIDASGLSINDTKGIDSLASVLGVRIYPLKPADKKLKGIEKDLVDAYVASAAGGEFNDNLQQMENDSLLLTRPQFKSNPDGSTEFVQAIGVMMAKRTVVLSMPKP
jgi:hypothetical protein